MSEADVINGIHKVLGKLGEEKNKKRFKKWNRKIGFTFEEFGKTWTTTLTAGVPDDLVEGPIDKSIKYDILVKTNSVTWLGVLNKEIDPIKAYSKGELKIKGSVTDLLKLRRVL
ncbi:MAG: SCP2 sterol-binding domain-containing protein [Candidatus Heimdallarchaeota archaeon]